MDRCIFILLIAGLLPSTSSSLHAQQHVNWTPMPGGVLPPIRVASRPQPFRQVSSKAESTRTSSVPNEAGQVWREHDIRSFTNRLRDQEKPEQAIVDWILRETGTNSWFGEPFSALSATRDKIRVYHTPAMQHVVEEVIDRFSNTRAEANQVAVRLVTVRSPDWRTRVLPMLRPVETKTPGLDAWVLSRENATLLLRDLSNRSDFQEHNSPNLTIHNGQTHTIKSTRPRTYSKAPTAAAGIAGLADRGQIDEGFTLEINPLISRDGRMMDAAIKCSVDQIEGFSPFWVDGVDQYGTLKRTQVQVPQFSSWRLNERFRWPINEVLLISRGMVPTPGPTGNSGTLRKILGNNSPARANALLFLESRPEIRSALLQSERVSNRTDATNYQGRY